ncbi:MAG: prenyltransferase [Phycisphaerales bacterium]|nr:prenyltransferase [Phycisphaerales bacterium]
MLLGSALAFAFTDRFSWPLFALLLPASILMQSAVNTLNDYYDFIKGTDRLENSNDPNDAILVYNTLNPKHVQQLGFTFMMLAVLLGLYPVYRGGPVTLLIGIVGCAVILAYSAGPKPISHLPLGELVSGTVMGGLIPLAVFSVFTGKLAWEIFLLSAPLIVGIALIMMTNNLCDIERDTPIGRRTLPILLGRPLAKKVFYCCVVIWILSILTCTLIRFRNGLPATALLLLPTLYLCTKLLRLPFTPDRRESCMRTIFLTNLFAHSAYLAAVLTHAIS